MRKREKFSPAIIVSGTCGVPSSGACQEELVVLQMAGRLLHMGFTLPGSSFFLCRIVCGRDVRGKILSREKTDPNLLILSIKEEGAEKTKNGKREKGRSYAITAAACFDALFFLIDMKNTSFRILPPFEAAQELEKAWKRKKETPS